MNELRKANCEDASSLHNSFCFSLAELSTAICKLSSSSASGPDQIAYPLLKHLHEPAQLFLLSLFNRSWYSHIFSSCWKPTTIIPIHKPGKPTSSLSSFCPIFLTSCISKLFERLILSCLTFHLESNHLLSTCQVGFRRGRSSLHQIFTLSQLIRDGFQKKKPLDRTILASVDFSKAFDSVWHSALYHKSLLLKLPPCFVLWVRSFLSDHRAKVQVGGFCCRSFRIRLGVPQGLVLVPVLFILFVDDITKDLPRGAHVSQYADDLAIWSSSPDPLKASSVVQSSLTVLETCSNLWRLLLNPKKCESSFFSSDPHQATFQPRLYLLGFPLSFNPTPKFLGVTFDRTLFFGAHVQSLCSKFYSRHKVLRSIATASWGPTKESLSLLYKAFVRPVLTNASAGWFPFLCKTAINHLEVLHRAACRVIAGCLSSTPSSLLLLEAQLPLLKLTLEHQALYSFKPALRLPPDFSSLFVLATRDVLCRLKKKPSRRTFFSLVTQPLPSPREILIMCPPFPPWTTTHFTVSPFIPDCTGNSTARLQSASNRLSSFPPSDIQVWADGSVPSLFGPGGAGVNVTCSKCNTSNFLSFSTGPIASSFAAETFARKQGLDWCTRDFTTCKFQSVLFLTDFQSALSILLSAPSYLLPDSFWNVWSLASSLSNNTTLSFQWVPGHAGLPGNEKADFLAKAGASLPTDAIPCPLPPVVAKVRYSQYYNWRRNIYHSYLNFQVPEVSSEELLLSRPIRCELSRLR